MKINYTEFLRKNRIKETNKEVIAVMHNKLVLALCQADIHGRIRATYYTDGCVKVELNGEYFNIFCTVSNTWFHGTVGDAVSGRNPYNMEKERSAICQNTP